ncbi:hypothetical protein CLAFUW4_12480 [Fulvia fulva]|uniref:Apple domain-containing protein n=1 Tax=Passalora fulva TaxID=5499 RepID=A0A9Q8PEH3_PASFU|nr:uncharacterized protein CLAFUR5_11507 [Fulvia fulva]KAK4617423.1 hypothetical protein CLAFUR4_12485 [Fulvia fulva]KAK4618682.1 hypothetical protein CLAFUR0_12496 [Fulvia fulva]UJO20983.1 hypothetical protein CLAFUR5_11507 [Fulvia fulva]WPV17795.1 hypothetical protein CLAFUW4_12480 [Fulvia fulva]WPV33470.1 hypothetical protein CLAFUW7_12487 [Fulvia fulva]
MARFPIDACRLAGIAVTLITTASAQNPPPPAYMASCPTPATTAPFTVRDECGMDYQISCGRNTGGTQDIDSGVYADTFNYCFQRCSANTECTSFTFQTESKRCYIKRLGSQNTWIAGNVYDISAIQILPRTGSPGACVPKPERNQILTTDDPAPVCPDNTDTLYNSANGNQYRLRCDTGFVNAGSYMMPPGNRGSFTACINSCTDAIQCSGISFAGFARPQDQGQGDCYRFTSANTGALVRGGGNVVAVRQSPAIVVPPAAVSTTTTTGTWTATTTLSTTFANSYAPSPTNVVVIGVPYPTTTSTLAGGYTTTETLTTIAGSDATPTATVVEGVPYSLPYIEFTGETLTGICPAGAGNTYRSAGQLYQISCDGAWANNIEDTGVSGQTVDQCLASCGANPQCGAATFSPGMDTGTSTGTCYLQTLTTYYERQLDDATDGNIAIRKIPGDILTQPVVTVSSTLIGDYSTRTTIMTITGGPGPSPSNTEVFGTPYSSPAATVTTLATACPQSAGSVYRDAGQLYQISCGGDFANDLQPATPGLNILYDQDLQDCITACTNRADCGAATLAGSTCVLKSLDTYYYRQEDTATEDNIAVRKIAGNVFTTTITASTTTTSDTSSSDTSTLSTLTGAYAATTTLTFPGTQVPPTPTTYIGVPNPAPTATIVPPSLPCPANPGQYYRSADGQLYQISCGGDYARDETPLPVPGIDLDACVALCDASDTCGAAVFDPRIGGACYRKLLNTYYYRQEDPDTASNVALRKVVGDRVTTTATTATTATAVVETSSDGDPATTTDTASGTSTSSTASTSSGAARATISAPASPCPNNVGQVYRSEDDVLWEISCDNDFTGYTDTNIATADSNIEACLALCEVTPGCGAAVFNTQNVHCYLKPENAPSTPPGEETAIGNVGFVRLEDQGDIPEDPNADVEIEDPTLPCPDYDGAIYRSEGGEEYRITCDSDFAFQGTSLGYGLILRNLGLEACLAECENNAGCGGAVLLAPDCFLKPPDTYLTRVGTAEGSVALRKISGPAVASSVSSATSEPTATSTTESASTLTDSVTSISSAISAPTPNPCPRGADGTVVLPYVDSFGDAYQVFCGGAAEYNQDLTQLNDLTNLDACMVACDTTLRCNAVSWIGGNSGAGQCTLKQGATQDGAVSDEMFVAVRVNGPVDSVPALSTSTEAATGTTATATSSTASINTDDVLTSSSTTSSATTSPTSSQCPEPLEDVCANEQNELGVITCIISDEYNELYSYNCGNTITGPTIPTDEVSPDPYGQVPDVVDLAGCNLLCERNRPRCKAVNFYPATGTCILVETPDGYEITPGAISCEQENSDSDGSTSSSTSGPTAPPYDSTATGGTASATSSQTDSATISTESSAPTASSSATESASSVSSTGTGTSSIPSAGSSSGGSSATGSMASQYPGGSSEASVATDSTTSSVFEATSSPTTDLSGTIFGSSSSSQSPYIIPTISTGSTTSSDLKVTSSPTTDLSGTISGSLSLSLPTDYFPGGPSQSDATTISTGVTQSLSTLSTDVSSAPSDGPPASEYPPPGGSSQTTGSSSSGGSVSTITVSIPSGSIMSVSSTTSTGTASATSGSEIPTGYENGSASGSSSTSSGSQQIPINYNTGSFTSTGPPLTGSNPASYPGGNGNGATSGSSTSTTTSGPAPYVSVCPAYDGQYFTAPAYGSSQYLVDCDSAYTGDEIINPIQYRQLSYSPQQGSCMATCDKMINCVAINVAPEGCQYFSRVNETLTISPGTIALLKTEQGTIPEYPGGVSTPPGSQTPTSPGTYPPGVSVTPSTPGGGSTPPGSIGTGTPATTPGGNETPPVYPPGSSGGSRTSTVNIVTVTVCSAQTTRTTTLFTTNTVTTCAAQGCPK